MCSSRETSSKDFCTSKSLVWVVGDGVKSQINYFRIEQATWLKSTQPRTGKKKPDK